MGYFQGILKLGVSNHLPDETMRRCIRSKRFKSLFFSDV